MRPTLTIKDILSSPCGGRNTHLKEEKVKKGKVVKKDVGAAYKAWMHDTLQTWCTEHSYLLIREHTFSEDRGWRLDWAVFNGTVKVIGVEYEGLMAKKSRHTTVAGYTEDTLKYTHAAMLGWKILRYTAKNYQQLQTDLSTINPSLKIK